MNTLKDHREALGLSQRALGRAIGIDRNAIMYWERGEKMPSQESIYKLVKFFNCTAKDLGFILLPSWQPSICNELLRKKRLAAGMTQAKLAKALGLTCTITVRRWEKGCHKPNYENLIKLTELFQCNIEELGYQWGALTEQEAIKKRNEVFMNYMHFLRDTVDGKWWIIKALGMDKEDVYQDLALQLLRAVERHDPRKGDLEHYISRCLSLHFRKLTAKAKAHGIHGAPKDFHPKFCSFETLTDAGCQFAADT